MRSPSKPLEAYKNLGSPDPLASSPASLTSTISSSKHALPTYPAQGHKVVRKSIERMSILAPSSPSRTVTEQTLSPWKIRVTVEAEPEDQTDAPVETVTRTTRVPLKKGDSPSHYTSNTGENSPSRQRTGSVISNRRRSTTPNAERRRRQSVTDLDIIVLGDDADEDEWGRRPRKVSPKKSKTQKKVAHASTAEAGNAGDTNFEIRQDTDMEDASHMSDREESPELRQIDLNRVSVRTRSNSNKLNAKSGGADNDETEARYTKPLPNMPAFARRTVSANSAMTYPTPSPTASERGRSVEADNIAEDIQDHAVGFDTIVESEGFTMIDLDSIPSVKQMLSSPLENQITSSLSKSGSHDESSSHVEGTVSSDITSPRPTASSAPTVAPSIVLPEGESEISSTLPSSPPSFVKQPQPLRQQIAPSHLQVPAHARNRQVTPQPYSSPKLPSPPKQPILKERSTPDSAKAMRAALVLQSAMQPATTIPIIPLSQQVRQPDFKRFPKPSTDSHEIFEGFNAGTQRELRAGLRFGEELAKRQQLQEAERQQRTAMSQIWRGESVISRTPTQGQTVQQNIGKNRGDSKHLAPTSSATLTSTSIRAPPLATSVRLEQEWQRDRDAVSKQIKEADVNEVIVIGSDTADDQQPSIQSNAHGVTKSIDVNDDDYEDGDIWLEEAKDSSSSPKQNDETLSSSPAYQIQDIEMAGRYEKPRRSLLPSSWKRDQPDDHANSSTIMTNADDMSGMLWKQQDHEDIHFGAAAISNVRRELKKSDGDGFRARRNSGAFDIEKMLGTPKRIRESLAKEQERQLSSDHAYNNSTASYSQEYHPETSNSDENEEEASQESIYTDESDEVDVQQPSQKVLVNFNDSTISQVQTTPPEFSRSNVSVSPPAARPPTPRSAMKGSRQSFGAAIEAQEQAGRKVIFAERSKGVNIDWVENSSSLLSSDENDIDSPTVEHQKHHEHRQLIASSSPYMEHIEHDSAPVQSPPPQNDDVVQPRAQKGLLSWIWGPKPPQAVAEASNTVQVDGTSESLHHPSHSQVDNDTSSRTTPKSQPQHTQPITEYKRPISKPRTHLASYLLPPSYPSDPTRTPTIPLSTTGSFTNIHFRTLHIIHRKSQRPRFHAPSFQTCRPEIRALASHRWKLSVDESSSGLGGFAWTVGETEARVLERFCREVEFGHLMRDAEGEDVDMLNEEWCGIGGIWGGRVEHGSADVRWGWSVEQLATWLGRIVVGEVVREEEFGGRI